MITKNDTYSAFLKTYSGSDDEKAKTDLTYQIGDVLKKLELWERLVPELREKGQLLKSLGGTAIDYKKLAEDFKDTIVCSLKDDLGKRFKSMDQKKVSVLCQLVRDELF